MIHLDNPHSGFSLYLFFAINNNDYSIHIIRKNLFHSKPTTFLSIVPLDILISLLLLLSLYSINHQYQFLLPSAAARISAKFILFTNTSMSKVLPISTSHQYIMRKNILNSPSSSLSSSSSQQPISRTFDIFTTEVPGFRETQGVKDAGLPSDQFSLQSILVNQGDKVTFNFYNLDDTDRHTFTIGAPYNVNMDIASGQNATASLVANYPGIFKYYCQYHQLSMAGELLVLEK
jgi:plastocyanin